MSSGKLASTSPNVTSGNGANAPSPRPAAGKLGPSNGAGLRSLKIGSRRLITREAIRECMAAHEVRP